jgi:hypothetical protein
MLVCPRDNTRRELIPQGQIGGLIIFEDHPNYWDAWGAFTVHMRRSEALLLTGSYGSSDVEIHHLEKADFKAQQLKFSNVKVVTSGPLLAAVETEAKYGKSTIKVTVSARRHATCGAYQLNNTLDLFEYLRRFALPTLGVRLGAKHIISAPPPLTPLINLYSTQVDWYERHEFLKCHCT